MEGSQSGYSRKEESKQSKHEEKEEAKKQEFQLDY